MQQPLEGEEHLKLEDLQDRSLAHKMVRSPRALLAPGHGASKRCLGLGDAQLRVEGLGLEAPPLYRRGSLLKGSMYFSSPTLHPMEPSCP
jgi:hypothetical protein